MRRAQPSLRRADRICHLCSRRWLPATALPSPCACDACALRLLHRFSPTRAAVDTDPSHVPRWWLRVALCALLGATVLPSTRVVSFKGRELAHGEGFVASSATIVGDVSLGEGASVWYGATVRGDGGAVKIGATSAVQDGAHVGVARGGDAVSIGNQVTIQAGAHVESAKIDDGAVVGMGARVLPGAHVGSDAFIDAGAVVEAGTKVGAGELWTGSPAAKLRDLNADERAYLRNTAEAAASLGRQHYGQSVKTVADIDRELDEKEIRESEGMEWDEPIATEDPDVAKYHHLTYNPMDVSLFRESDFDEEQVRRTFEEEQAALEAEAEAEAEDLAIMEMVSDTVDQIVAALPHERDGLIARLREREPRAAEVLDSMIGRVEKAKVDESEARALEKDIQEVEPEFFIFSPEEAAKSKADAKA